MLQGINKHDKKFQTKIRSGKAASGPRPFFAIPYTGKNHKNGFFGVFLSFFGIGIIFLKYKPLEGIEFIFVFKSLGQRPTGFHELLQGINKHHKKFQAKIRSGKAASGPRPFFAIPYTGKNHKNGFFGVFLSFFGIGIIFLKYKPLEGIEFIFVFKSLGQRPTGFPTTPYFNRRNRENR